MKLFVKFNNGDTISTDVDSESIKSFFKEVAAGNDWIMTNDSLFKREDVLYICKEN